MPAPDSIMALDYGDARVGVAITSLIARLPHPHITIPQDDELLDVIEGIVEVENIKLIVVGWPRGLAGQHTGQTEAVETFVKGLKQRFALPIELQDEALTSKKAEVELRGRGKPFVRGDIDALAATFILEDYLRDHEVVEVA